MAKSTGGFWSGGFGQALAGIGAALGLGPLFDTALNREMTANENDLSRLHDQFMLGESQSNALQQMRVQQSNVLAQMQKQQDFEKYMADTQYQRLVNDMERAGLNPASLMGSVHAGSSVPNASIGSAGTPGSGASSSRALGYHEQNNFMTSMMTSALNGMIAKDRDAARYLSEEMIDNAKHAHRMEENFERDQLYHVLAKDKENDLYNKILKEK